MSFELCFSPEFFINELDEYNQDKPTNVLDAICSMMEAQPEKWENMKQEVFNIDSNIFLNPESVLEKIQETNTCSNLTVPVEVWIDSEGFYTVLVYDK